MKIKHYLAVMLSGTALSFVLRLLQHLFIIDDSGFYTTTDMPWAILIWALYGVFALALVFAAVVMVIGDGNQADIGIVQGAGILGVLYIVVAALTMVHSGISLVSHSDAPDLLLRILAVTGILSANHFAVLGICTLKNNPRPVTGIFGLFPPVYVVVQAVCEFYSSFKGAQMSEAVMKTVALCALALFVTALCLTASGAPITKRRVTATVTAYPVFAAASALLFFMAPGSPADIVFSVIQIVFMLIAFIMLTNIDYVRPQMAEMQPQGEKNDGLDRYMDQIPDEETEEEVNE